jgi:hypothetical protein
MLRVADCTTLFAIPMRVMRAAIDATAKSFAKSLLMQFLSFEA